VRASLAALEIQSQQQQQQHQQQQAFLQQQQQQFIQSPQLQSSLSSATPPRSGPSALPSYAGGWDSAGTVTASPPASFQGNSLVVSAHSLTYRWRC
jgi:transcription initiation factor TFIID subunit TAF12